jgi:serine/threonine protein phosphatase PrpC
LSDKNIKFSHAATTLTFCFVDDEGLHIGHVGDCRLYVKTDSKLKQITKDHTQHQKLLDDKIYSKSELKQLPGKIPHYGNCECDPTRFPTNLYPS